MNNVITFPNPPVVEAILDVSVVLPENLKLTDLSDLHAQFRDTYPIKEDMRVMEFQLEQKGQNPLRSEARDFGVTGYRFLTNDRKELIQCRKNGFTFNRLKPYPNWADVSAKANAAWSIYRDALPQAKITRVALRYINQIVVPMPSGSLELNDYFNVNFPGPKIEGLTYSGLLGQALFLDNISGLQANWTLARQAPEPKQLTMVLDIDVFTSDAKALDIEIPDLWDSMRDLKNRLFFGSITAKTHTLFQ